MQMKPNDHEKREWSRMATAAYRKGFNAVGHRYSVMSSLKRDETMPLSVFDMLQDGYRAWLTYGWPGFRTTDIGRTFADVQDAYTA